MSSVKNKNYISQINSMKCFAFQYAIDRWNVSSLDAIKIFEKGKIFKFIEENYEYLHINGYEFILDDIEEFLDDKGIIYDKKIKK